MITNCQSAWSSLDLSTCNPLGLSLAEWVTIVAGIFAILGALRFAIVPILRKIGWLGPRRVTSFRSLKSQIRPLAQENRRLFETFGPRSSVSSREPEKFDNATWQATRLNLASNNAQILELLRQHRNFIPKHHKPAFEAWEAHILAFDAHIDDPSVDYRHHQYPQEIDKIFGQ